jgi:flagellar protein FliS
VFAQTRAAEAYRRVNVQSRSPLELVVMLYDGALSSLRDAGAAAARSDAVGQSASVSKALTIINSLQDSLNLEEGGAVAAELDRLYTYASERLLDVTTKHDVSGLNEVHKLLAPLRDAWQHIATEQLERTS